jgi:hypothetical protein
MWCFRAYLLCWRQIEGSVPSLEIHQPHTQQASKPQALGSVAVEPLA